MVDADLPEFAGLADSEAQRGRDAIDRIWQDYGQGQPRPRQMHTRRRTMVRPAAAPVARRRWRRQRPLRRLQWR